MSELKTESFSAGHRWGGWVNYICAPGAVLAPKGVLASLREAAWLRVES